MADQPAEVKEVSKERWYKRGSAWRRIGSDGAAFTVGANAAYLSWKHIVHASILLHQEGLAAYLYPISIDGAMIVGVIKAADDRASGRKVRGWARIVTWAGGLVSIAAQILSAWQWGYGAAAWSVVPAAFLIMVVEVMARRGKLLKTSPAVVETVAIVTSVEPVVASAPEPAPALSTAEPVAPDTPDGPVVVEDQPTDEPRSARRKVRAAPRTMIKAPKGMAGGPGGGASTEEIESARVNLVERRRSEVTPVFSADAEPEPLPVVG